MAPEMRLKLIIAIMTICALAAHAEESAVDKGKKALSSHLWEVAATHFQDALKQPELPDEEKSKISLLLAEAWLRDNKANQALELLQSPTLAEHPENGFWVGQALAAQGKFAEAVATLKPIALNPDSSRRYNAGFTAASLELALGQEDAAIETLSALTKSPNPQLASRARIRQAQIYIDQNKADQALNVMPKTENIAEKDQALATFINANIFYQQKDYDAAEKNFRTLVDKPESQGKQQYHSAIIGLADTLIAKGETTAAAELLLNFIQENPTSPQLEEIFKRLLTTIPESPAITDPTLEKLTQWIPPSQIPATGIINTMSDSAVAAWPTESVTNDLQAFAIFTRAQGLHRINNPEAKSEAKFLLNRLRIENPKHFLSIKALLVIAKWDLQAGNTERAYSTLRTIAETATSPLIQGEAAFTQALSAHEKGDTEQAIALFSQAADSLTGMESDIAKFNTALIEITHALDPSPEAKPIQDPAMVSSLKLERALVIDDPAERRMAIESFLIEHPDHPRSAEARLKVAEAALSTNPADISFATAQIETIKSDPKMVDALKPIEIDLIQLRILDLSNDSDATILFAKDLLTKYAETEAAEEISLVLGRNHYQAGNYNDARLVLEQLASKVNDPARAQAALLLAARSAALVPTTQSQQEALTLFDKAIDAKGPVTALAKLEKGRLMIDMGQLTDATAFLRPWFDSIPTDDPLHMPAGFLLGESIYAQGNINPESLAEALKIYDGLLQHTEAYSAVYNRLQYLRGRTLEQLPAEDDPTRTREKQAFIAYYSVLERTTPPEEWQYFELSGFRALSLLEKAQRWPAAIACAKKIASFGGPRAKEASTRASQLQLKHMIWED